MNMKIATFNVNGVNGRLPRLLEWLAETQPDVACLQEIKTADAVARRAIEAAGYAPSGMASPRITASPSWPAASTPGRSGAGCRATTPTSRPATWKRR